MNAVPPIYDRLNVLARKVLEDGVFADLRVEELISPSITVV